MNGVQKMKAFYEHTPSSPIYQTEFGYYSLDRWKREGHITEQTDLNRLFGFDEPGFITLDQLGWCEAAFAPAFEVKVLEDRGDYELVQDAAGRGVLYFKGRRDGFMPEYETHPVTDRRSWEENVKGRLTPDAPERYRDLEERMARARQAQASGQFVTQNLIGGYMYLRSLMGPVQLLYMFYDDPELIHDCMRTWFALADAVIARHQQYVELDELFLAEDICYNHGSLISHDMMREFLFPYYQQLIANARKRQTGSGRTLHIQIDTDGWAGDVIDVYREIGMDYMSPFEVASGCDVVALSRKYPELLMRGGIDKRVLAQSPEAIDRMVDAIMPAMVKRGGYIPVCDHGVPEEVSFENYLHFRRRMLEFA